MENSLRQFDRPSTTVAKHVARHRFGFTMVELLIAVAILVILTTLTVSAFNVNDADRVSNSIGTFKNALEGARSRAISSGEFRGLRLITDPNDGRIVKSMIYLGSAGAIEGELTIGGYNSNTNRFVVTETASDWANLGTGERELIQQGSRIEIPANSGRWYTVFHPPNVSSQTNDDEMILSGIFTPGEWVSGSYREVPSGANFTYRLELEPTILDGAEPILLDPQTCIDMDGSFVPTTWRPGKVDDPYGVDRRPEDNMPPDPPIFTDMDILFAPDGTITGDAKTFGVFRFRFAYVSDVVLAESLRSPGLFQDGSTTAVVPADPEKDHKALAIFAQTGGIVIADIDPTTSSSLTDGFNNDAASQPYSYALLGKESN